MTWIKTATGELVNSDHLTRVYRRAYRIADPAGDRYDVMGALSTVTGCDGESSAATVILTSRMREEDTVDDRDELFDALEAGRSAFAFRPSWPGSSPLPETPTP